MNVDEKFKEECRELWRRVYTAAIVASSPGAGRSGVAVEAAVYAVKKYKEEYCP